MGQRLPAHFYEPGIGPRMAFVHGHPAPVEPGSERVAYPRQWCDLFGTKPGIGLKHGINIRQRAIGIRLQHRHGVPVGQVFDAKHQILHGRLIGHDGPSDRNYGFLTPIPTIICQ